MADEVALIIGAGPGISGSCAKLFAKDGIKVALAARNPDKLDGLVKETGGKAYACDASDKDDVKKLFDAVEKDFALPDVVVFNPSYRSRGPLVEIKPEDVEKTLMVSSYGGFLVGREAAERMLKRDGDHKGSILFTGASASVKGYAQSAPFAMGKFALRGLAQSMARELHPQGIHIGHFVIDGGVWKENHPYAEKVGEDGLLHPDEIAKEYLRFHRQDRTIWAWEIELRPYKENF